MTAAAYLARVLLDSGAAGTVEQVLADRVSGLLQEVFAGLERLRATAERVLSAGDRDRASLKPLRQGAADLLGRPDRLVAGAGYVAEPGFLSDAVHWLQWWTAGEHGPQSLDLPLDGGPGGALDYVRQPWLTGPRASGRRQIAGPYVDYVCSDEYVLTLSVPVVVGGAFAGIVGADVPVSRLEPHVLELHALGRPAALVNASGRVVVGAGGLVSGVLVREVPVAALWGGRGGRGGRRGAAPLPGRAAARAARAGRHRPTALDAAAGGRGRRGGGGCRARRRHAVDRHGCRGLLPTTPSSRRCRHWTTRACPPASARLGLTRDREQGVVRRQGRSAA